jgi:citrate lyase subunit beta / citryl-CoA lyase
VPAGRRARFDGKTLIHPQQIDPANRAFAPDAQEVAAARRIMEAHEAARREGKGVVVVDGRLIENLQVAEAERRVRLAAMIATMTG